MGVNYFLGCLFFLAASLTAMTAFSVDNKNQSVMVGTNFIWKTNPRWELVRPFKDNLPNYFVFRNKIVNDIFNVNYESMITSKEVWQCPHHENYKIGSGRILRLCKEVRGDFVNLSYTVKFDENLTWRYNFSADKGVKQKEWIEFFKNWKLE